MRCFMDERINLAGPDCQGRSGLIHAKYTRTTYHSPLLTIGPSALRSALAFGFCSGYATSPSRTATGGRSAYGRLACRSPGAPTPIGATVPGRPAGPHGHDGGGGDGDRPAGRGIAGGRTATGSRDTLAGWGWVHGSAAIGVPVGGIVGGALGVGRRRGGDRRDVLETGPSAFPSPRGRCGVVRGGVAAIGRVRPRRPDVWRGGVGGWRGCPPGSWGAGGWVGARGGGERSAGGSSAGVVGL
jgi:hypothetical protein